jgi:hypothetical protein
VRIEITAGDRLLARGDLGYRRWLIWIEYDGFDVHSDREAFRGDRHRDRWLARRGWEVMRLSDRDLRSSQSFLEQLHGAINEAPARIAAMPRTRSPEVAAARAALLIDSPLVATPLGSADSAPAPSHRRDHDDPDSLSPKCRLSDRRVRHMSS